MASDTQGGPPGTVIRCRHTSSSRTIACIGLQDSAQMRLAQDDEMIDTLTPDRPDQPFGKAILPRRGRRGGLVPNPHGAQSACDDGAIDPIPVANEVAWRLIPRESLC